MLAGLHSPQDLDLCGTVSLVAVLQLGLFGPEAVAASTLLLLELDVLGERRDSQPAVVVQFQLVEWDRLAFVQEQVLLFRGDEWGFRVPMVMIRSSSRVVRARSKWSRSSILWALVDVVGRIADRSFEVDWGHKLGWGVPEQVHCLMSFL
jgi:hypothetical protein